MTFEAGILTDCFSSLFYRRPLNSGLAGSGKVNTKAGSNEQITINGQYLEGNCSLYSNSNRITIQDIQQHGELKNTNLTAVINATRGEDQSNIGLYGYVAGQEGNDTAKFTINNCLDIQDYTPVIYDYTYQIYSLRFPESIVFNVSTNEDVKSLIVNGQETTAKEFVYTFPSPGSYQVAIQGKSDAGELSNIVTKQITILQRPFITGVYIKKNPGATWQQNLQTKIAGVTYVTSPLTGNIIAVAEIYFNTTANIRLQLEYNAGGLGYPLGGSTIKEYVLLQNGTYYSIARDPNPHYLYLKAQNYNSYYPYNQTQIILIIYPYNSVMTQGYGFELGLNLIGVNVNAGFVVDYDDPPAGLSSNTRTVYGNIMTNASVQGVIVPNNYGVIRERTTSLEVSASIIGSR